METRIARQPAVNLVLGAAVAVFLSLVSGCRDSRTLSSLSVTGGGRQVKARVDGPAFLSSREDRAVLTFGGRTLAVEKERLLLDEKELARLPGDGADRVDIEVQDGRLKVTADAATVFWGPLSP